MNKKNSELENAMTKISKDLFYSLEPGKQIKLTDNFILYRYIDDDIYVINEEEKWEEKLQVMTDGNNFLFEEL